MLSEGRPGVDDLFSLHEGTLQAILVFAPLLWCPSSTTRYEDRTHVKEILDEDG